MVVGLFDLPLTFFEQLIERKFFITNVNSIDSLQNNLPLSNQRPISDDLKPLSNHGNQKSTEDKDTVNSAAANYDQYIKSDGKPEQSPGIYRLENDENGNQRIVFNSPEEKKETVQADSQAVAPADTAAKASKALSERADPDDGNKKPEPEDAPKKNVEAGRYFADDSQWKAEIGRIKQERQQLLQEISSARDDEDKQKELEARLAQVEAELAAKDTESYRKQHLVLRYLGPASTNDEDAAKMP